METESATQICVFDESQHYPAKTYRRCCHIIMLACIFLKHITPHWFQFSLITEQKASPVSISHIKGASTPPQPLALKCASSLHHSFCRCQGWTRWLQHAGLASCCRLSCVSQCCARAVVEGPGVPLEGPPLAAQMRGHTEEEATQVGPAHASGWQGELPQWGWQVQLQQVQLWH